MTDRELFTEAENAASAAKGKEFYQFTMAAWENAMDTVYVEKEAPEADLYKIALRTLEMLLGDTDDAEAQKFFVNLGVTY